MEALRRIYKRRFTPDVDFRKEFYKILCKDFYSKYIPKNAVLLDIATGYCEFINTIQVKKKFAVDLNPDAKKYAAKDVNLIIAPSTDITPVKTGSIDIVHVSNFFEHLTREDIVKSLAEIHRVLKKGGKILVMQPNIRYCYKDYWMFFDHLTPLDDRSLCEVLEISGFEVEECIPRFLPYTTKSDLPKSLLLAKIYINFPSLYKLFGQQAFIVARKKQ